MKWLKNLLKHRRKNIIEYCAKIADRAYDPKNPTLHNAGKTVGKLIRGFK